MTGSDHAWVDEGHKALIALADLTPSAEARGAAGSIPLDWFRWLDARDTGVLNEPRPFDASGAGTRSDAMNIVMSAAGYHQARVERKFAERLAAVDQLRAGQHSLRVGWLFLAGRSVGEDGTMRRVFQPLVTRPVKVDTIPVVGAAHLSPVGDVELSELITDRGLRHSLDAQIQTAGGALAGITDPVIPAGLLGRLTQLRSFAVAASRATGFPATTLVPADKSPDQFMRADHLVIVAGLAVYAITETGELTRAASLEGWVKEGIDTWTALHSLYVDAPDRVDDAPPHDEPLRSPFALTPAQTTAVLQSRHAPITVVKGAPGTGKSHTITAIACDALAREQTVLVVARSDATIDALVELFERAPGPRPVVFGSNERRDALAEHLAGGLEPCTRSALQLSLRRLAVAESRHGDMVAAMHERLSAESLLESPDRADDARGAWPELFEVGADLDRWTDAADAAAAPPGSFLDRWRLRRVRNELEEQFRVANPDDLDAFREALGLARAARAARNLGEAATTADAPGWPALIEVDDTVRRLTAEWLALASRSPDRLTRASLGSVAALATALRSGRGARRAQLSRIDDELTRALPLWAGTLADVDDLLPTIAGLFDLVILDEASSIDQPTAASALLRGRRAVIAGDPKQLRHVSFLSDEQRDKAVRGAGIDASSPLAWRLDVRRNSAFDLAAATSPVITLDEHFRCLPHLVDFVAERLYDGQVHVATRTPATQGVDCIDTVRITGARNQASVVEAEVAWIIQRVRACIGSGLTVGVVTPFRAQADALEAAALDAFTVAEMQQLDLRLGTVHAFQGNERDIVVASLGIGEADKASWRFVTDPHLFTVFVTRARQRFVLVHSADPPEGSILADYLAHAEVAPAAPTPVAPLEGWAASLAAELQGEGLGVTASYPSGRHVVDIVTEGPAGFFGIECTVHPDGVDAHIERHLAMTRQGWRLRDAFPSASRDALGELVVELTGEPDDRPAPH